MLSTNNPQIDVFTQMIYDKLIPKDHLLVRINETIDFSFFYEIVEDCYSKNQGRPSKDPVVMLKLILLEYLYNLSDVEVSKRANTDIVFRWFLGLSIDDLVPDDTTISHFRVKRLGKEKFDKFFEGLIKQCIEQDLIKNKRYIIDSTDVSVNASLPFGKKLIRDAFKKVARQIERFDEKLAADSLKSYEEAISKEYESGEKVTADKHYDVTLRQLEKLYVSTNEELQTNEKYREAFEICYEIADGYLNKKQDKIISVVDPDARVAYKSPRNPKTGYKNHIIIDEDSELILASNQTPFNVGDQKELKSLIEKARENTGLKPEEISADKVYSTNENREYLEKENIVTNIPFPDKSERNKLFALEDFAIGDGLKHVICPNGAKTTDITYHPATEKADPYYTARFSKKHCSKCPLKDSCLAQNSKGKQKTFRVLSVPSCYRAIVRDRQRVQSEEFKEAYKGRFKIERRFGHIAWNLGLRRSRYLRLERSSIHIILSNTVTNMVRMVNLLAVAEGT